MEIYQRRCSSKFHSATIVVLNLIDLSRDLFSEAKFFAEDTSLFYMAHDINTSGKKLNNDLKRASNWGFQ